MIEREEGVMSEIPNHNDSILGPGNKNEVDKVLVYDGVPICSWTTFEGLNISSGLKKRLQVYIWTGRMICKTKSIVSP